MINYIQVNSGEMVQAWSMGSSKKCKFSNYKRLGPEQSQEKKAIPGPGAYSPEKTTIAEASQP